jgi:hypothetical protein
MKLRALHLTNVRKFTHKRASITGIGPGITVVSEANEFGKSTFFDAIHALFFEKYGSSAKPVKSLQPYAGGAVEVAAEIETDQGLFLVEKRFLLRKMARIVRLSDQVTIAQDDEAERWISAALGEGNDGPAGLLWVRQGQLGLEPEGKTEKALLMETRRDLLTSVAGEIDVMTGGRRMDRVMRRLAEDLDKITTKTGRKSGAWKVAADEVVALEDGLAKLTAQVGLLDGALAERRAAEATLARLEHPDARARRDAALHAAQAALDVARAHDGVVTAARQDRDIAALQSRAAKADLDAFLASIDKLTRCQAVVTETATARRKAAADVADLKGIADRAAQRAGAAVQAVATARAALEAARRQIAARKAKAEALQLSTRITKAQAAQAQRDAARARVKGSLATADWLARTEAAASAVEKKEAAHQAQTTVISVVYSGAARIALNGAPMLDAQPVAIDAQAVIDLPQIGQMTIRTQALAAGGADQLALAKSQLADLLSVCGSGSVAMARHAAADRAEAVRQADLAQAVLDTLAPSGIDALTADLAEANLAATGAQDAPLGMIADLEGQLEHAVADQDRAAQSQRRAAEDHAGAREIAVQAVAVDDAAMAELDRATAAAGPDDNREQRRAGHLRIAAQTTKALTDADSKLAEIIAAAPDLSTCHAEWQRANDAVGAASRERAQVAERLAALSAQIRTLAGNGIEERRDEISGQLESAKASEARFAKRAAALTRLQTALEAERNAAQETYFGPVQEELKPLLAILHRDAALSFDSDNLLPSGLKRGQTEETLENLSGGTKEQIAILTRLAFARLFARQGRHMPIVLDDALVFSDDDRIIKMFTALTRVAQGQQIIVFSCRQLAFQDLGGARPMVEVVDA